MTYGIGSQRGDGSTGCQLIGQSPVHSVSRPAHGPPPVAILGLGARPGSLLLACWAAAAASASPWGPARTPDNSSPTGMSGHFHMELLLQGVGAIRRPGPCPPGLSLRAEV